MWTRPQCICTSQRGRGVRASPPPLQPRRVAEEAEEEAEAAAAAEGECAGDMLLFGDIEVVEGGRGEGTEEATRSV
jgi:hypothetical protein